MLFTLLILAIVAGMIHGSNLNLRSNSPDNFYSLMGRSTSQVVLALGPPTTTDTCSLPKLEREGNYSGKGLMYIFSWKNKTENGTSKHLMCLVYGVVVSEIFEFSRMRDGQVLSTRKEVIDYLLLKALKNSYISKKGIAV